MREMLLCVMVMTVLLLNGCERDQTATAPPDAPTGYDPRAAAGDQPPVDRGDDARPAAAEVGDNVPQGTVILAETDRQFLLEAIRHNDVKLKLAKMAQKQAENERVRQYAQRVLDEQLQTNTELRMLATRLNVELKVAPPGTGDEAGQIIERFERLSGAQFEQSYARHEIDSHQRMIQRFQQAASEVKNAEVLAFINRATSELQSHLQDAQRMTAPADPA